MSRLLPLALIAVLGLSSCSLPTLPLAQQAELGTISQDGIDAWLSGDAEGFRDSIEEAAKEGALAGAAARVPEAVARVATNPSNWQSWVAGIGTLLAGAIAGFSHTYAHKRGRKRGAAETRVNAALGLNGERKT